MPVSKESVLKVFHEQVIRPLDPAIAEKISTLLSPLIDELNHVEPAMNVQPSLVFQSTHNFAEGCVLANDGTGVGLPPNF